MTSTVPDQNSLMKEVLETLKLLQINQTRLASNVDAITGRVNILAGIKEVHDVASIDEQRVIKEPQVKSDTHETHDHANAVESPIPQSPSIVPTDSTQDGGSSALSVSSPKKHSVTSRIILT